MVKIKVDKKVKLTKKNVFMHLHNILNTPESFLTNNNTEYITCREKESQKLYDFFENKNLNDLKILYVYGPPGTGKTMTIKHVLKSEKLNEIVN